VKVKFVGATPEEDKIVEIPEGVKELTIQPPALHKDNSAWPVALVLITAMMCFTAVIWLFTR
jgi:hypothetical protein